MNHHALRRICGLIAGAVVLLAAAGCKGHTHITGTIKNKWGSPVYPATVTLRQGERMQQGQTSREGKYDIALEHAPFNVELKLTAASDFYKTMEKSFSSRDHLQNVNLTMEELPEPTLGELRKSLLKGITVKDAKELAELMCRQLPNVSFFPMKSFMSGDDVHDTLVMLSGVAQPCLVDHITDSGYMPDSRSEPLADFRAGDAALWILADAGLDFDGAIVPLLNQKRWNGIGVYEYFQWVNQGNHRQLVQAAVKHWLQQHPQCCGSDADVSDAAETRASYRISPQRLAELQQALARLKPGMDEKLARQILGPADAETDPGKMDGVADLNRYEKAAAFYFVQGKASSNGKPDFRRRNFFHDRYVIVFFSENGKFVRAFSNVPELPPVFPRSEKLWTGMIYASMAARK